MHALPLLRRLPLPAALIRRLPRPVPFPPALLRTLPLPFARRTCRRTRLALAFAFAPVLVAAGSLAAQGDARAADPATLVAALGDAGRAAGASEALVALGAAAVPALRARLVALAAAPRVHAPHQPPDAEPLLAVVVRLGPLAAAAAPDVRALLACGSIDAHPILAALAELAPWSGWNDTDVRDVAREALLLRVSRCRNCGEPTVADALAQQRWWARAGFPRELDVPTLLAVAGGRDALRAELAVEWLGRRGPAAAAALPLLRTLLERPEPRVLLTQRRLPLHRKVAAAILAIAAPSDAAALARDPTAAAIERDGDTAALALDVLAGRRPPPTPAPRAWPARVEQRVAALVVELADPARSAAASANLAALGEPACLPVARLLQPANGAPTIDAALATLRALGPAAGAAAEPLVDALTALPAAHAAAVVDALAAVVPGCGDVVPTLACVGRLPELRVLDRRIVGIDAAAATALTRALARLRTIQRVGSELLAAELVIPLTDPDVELRERALVVAAERGAAARPLRPLLAELLQCSRATRHELRWSDDRTVAVDRTGHVHRLAARAIAAIVEPGDPLRALAEQVLARPEPR